MGNFLGVYKLLLHKETWQLKKKEINKQRKRQEGKNDG